MRIRTFSWILSVLALLLAIFLYVFRNPYWYYPAVIGVWFFFDNLSHLRGQKTTLDFLLKSKPRRGLYLYFSLFLLGFFIEIIGRIFLNLWYYPRLPPFVVNTLTFLFYPFILMSFRETYVFTQSFFGHPLPSVIMSMLFGILIWEIPNVYSQDWVYTILYSSLEAFHINVIVIFGWSILILAPLYIYKIVIKEKHILD